MAQQLVAIANAFHAYSSICAEKGLKEGDKDQERRGTNPSCELQTMRQTVTSVIPIVYQILSAVSK